MAHDIMELDCPMFADVGAWHPLGKIVKGCKTLFEALQLGGLDWTVKQDRLRRVRDHELCDDTVENYRSDSGTALGCVGIGWKPVQNMELAELGSDVIEMMGGNRASVDTAGSVLNGKKVWFCIRTDSFEAVKGDPLQTYLMLANAHDGSMAASFYFTSIRVVCHNTFKMSLSSAESIIRFRHEGDIEKKLEATGKAIANFAQTQKKYRESVMALSNRKMTADEVKDWVAEALTITEGPLVSAKDAETSNRKMGKRTRQMEAYKVIVSNFKKEGDFLGVNPQSAWLVHNAHTRWLQSQRTIRSGDKSAAAIAEKRMATDLFGPVQQAKQKSWEMAMALLPS